MARDRRQYRPMTKVGAVALLVVGLLAAGLGSGRPVAAQELSESAQRQVQAILADKAAWTPAQRKMATSLLMAHRESLGRAMVRGVAPLRRTADRARVDGAGRVVVDIDALVTESVLQAITDAGGEVISSYPAFRAIRARVPIRRIDEIAALPEVRRIGARQPFLLNTGSQTSQGDTAHAAASARTTHGISGAGVKVGVLSDGVASLAARQATGDVPPTCPAAGACITVLPGQAGSGDEGTAMLEIVHDLAPGAQLFFATAVTGSATFAANILALRNTHGCDIIVDDVTYLDEGAFQDGTIAQAVNAVKASGALFFSSAGNSGRMNAGTSGTWEGDFLDSGTTIPFFTGSDWEGLPIHTFNGLTGGSAANSDQFTTPLPGSGSQATTLQWSDPLGAASADYDLFLFDSTLSNVVDASFDDQSVTQEPFEIMNGGAVGQRIVIVRFSGPTRALRVDTFRGRLTHATAGAVFGHNGGESTVSVAAVHVGFAGGGAFTGGTANIESYSSDGPRRLFFNPNGSAITPGNVLFATNGGRSVEKPDITAADCVFTTSPGFSTFCGTSAAAPHGAAIAALLKSMPGQPSGGQALAAMFSTALDVNPAGRDRDAGVGIVMANLAAGALTSVPALDFFTVAPCRVFDTRAAAGPTGGAPLTCGTDQSFTIVGGACGIPAGAKAVSINVSVTQPSSPGNLGLFAAGAPVPGVSSLNYSAGQTRGNNGIAPLSAAGLMAVRCAPTGTAHVILDVFGYFQ